MSASAATGRLRRLGIAAIAVAGFAIMTLLVGTAQAQPAPIGTAGWQYYVAQPAPIGMPAWRYSAAPPRASYPNDDGGAGFGYRKRRPGDWIGGGRHPH